MNVYGDLSISQLPEGNWQETEEAYVEMSGGLIDTLQNTESLKRSVEPNNTPMDSSNPTDGYVDMNTLTRKRKEESIKCSSMKTNRTKTKSCTTVLLAITVSAVISIAVSVATQIFFEYIFHDIQSPSDHPTKFNCTSWIAARCTLNYIDNSTYECVTESIGIGDNGLILMSMQCVQLSAYELSLPMTSFLIIEEELNEAKCSCTVKNDSNKNSTLLCGIWISNCSPNNGS
jgi:hypothetical protein